jgi:general secretion pathway protein H
MHSQRGFTLIELLVVLAIMAICVAGASLSLRDSAQEGLEREAQQLIAQLDKARALSRTSAQAIVWQATPTGYAFMPSAASSKIATVQVAWLLPQTQVSTTTPRVFLGPEPVIAPTQITLSLSDKPQLRVHVQTDGVGGFELRP